MRKKDGGVQQILFSPGEMQLSLHPFCLATKMRLEYVPQEIIYLNLAKVHLVNNSSLRARTDQRRTVLK